MIPHFHRTIPSAPFPCDIEFITVVSSNLVLLASQGGSGVRVYTYGISLVAAPGHAGGFTCRGVLTEVTGPSDPTTTKRMTAHLVVEALALRGSKSPKEPRRFVLFVS